MTNRRKLQFTGVLLACAVARFALLRTLPPLKPKSPATTRETVPPPPRTASAAALHEACRYWVHAQMVVNRERYALLDWDPAALSSDSDEGFRQRVMAREHTAELGRARTAARRAAALAQGPEELCRALEALVLIEHDAGHPAEELKQMKLLRKLASDSRVPLDALLRAAARTDGHERQTPRSTAAPEATHRVLPMKPQADPQPIPSPSTAARRRACEDWTRAQRQVNQELDSLAEWDPKALAEAAGASRENRPRQLMARDRGGDLHRARRGVAGSGARPNSGRPL